MTMKSALKIILIRIHVALARLSPEYAKKLGLVGFGRLLPEFAISFVRANRPEAPTFKQLLGLAK